MPLSVAVPQFPTSESEVSLVFRLREEALMYTGDWGLGTGDWTTPCRNRLTNSDISPDPSRKEKGMRVYPGQNVAFRPQNSLRSDLFSPCVPYYLAANWEISRLGAESPLPEHYLSYCRHLPALSLCLSLLSSFLYYGQNLTLFFAVHSYPLFLIDCRPT